jgi:glycosyltransferase involved in cell wall biosynthesis
LPRDLAYSLVFFQSLRETNPEWEPYLLLAGGDERLASRDRSIGGVRISTPYEMMDAERYRALLFSYDADSLVALLRPLWLKHALARSPGQAWLFEPKTFVISALEPIVTSLGAFSVALVPRRRTSLAVRSPSDADFADAGVFDSGYVAVASSSDAFAFLDWWERGWESKRLLDHAPALFDDVVVLRDERFNAGFDDVREDVISLGLPAFDPAQARVRPSDHPSLVALLARYRRLLSESGHEFHREEPYAGERFSNGALVDDRVRRLHRAARDAGLQFDDPWNSSAHPSLYEWVTSPAEGAEASERPLTRYLEALHASRADLVAAFPAPGGRDREAFFRWLDSDPNHGADVRYVRPAAQTTADLTIPGVNVAGYLRSELGVGEAGRAHVRALRAAGAKTALVDVSAGSANRQSDRTFTAFSAGNPYPINLICVNADQVTWFADRVGRDFFAGKYNIGSWWWELPVFPDAWRTVLPYFQELWVGSHFIADAVTRVAPVPVIRVPPVVDVTRRSAVGKDHFGISADAFSFLFTFDYLSNFNRKNPMAVVRAFQSAFRGNPNVQLVLKSINDERDPPNAALLRSQAASDPRIVLLGRYMSVEEKNALITACDAYISLHRSEGFGLTIAEAMALGKPVIATGWSGNMDFMTAFNSFPVDSDLVKIERDEGPYRAGQLWAAPNEEHAASLMRRVLGDDDGRTRTAARGQAEIRTRFSPDSVARIVRDRLTVLAGVLQVP